MFTIFKYIDYALRAKQGYEAPEELIADTAFGPVEGMFILSFVILFLFSGGSLFVGFYYSLLFFKIIGFLLVAILIADILLFRFLKGLVNKISKKVTHEIKTGINNHRTYDIPEKDINSTQM